jgi:hypothetical protein
MASDRERDSSRRSAASRLPLHPASGTGAPFWKIPHSAEPPVTRDRLRRSSGHEPYVTALAALVDTEIVDLRQLPAANNH